MVSNKDRLYIALYPSGVVNNDERKYHWGFLIGPKDESKRKVPGLRCHVRNHPLQGWKYEEVELEDVRATATLLARMIIAKIEDKERLLKILRNTLLWFKTIHTFAVGLGYRMLCREYPIPSPAWL
ncbi:hypothetical protein MY4038_007058, partial [Beauveria bassiana]